MRSPLTEADADLLAYLERSGFEVSRYQLERWRQHGLLPRATVIWDGFGGSSVRPHRTTVYEAALVLAEYSGRGRAWQVAAVWLFEDGLPISSDALRQTCRWQSQRVGRMLRRMVERSVGPAADVDAAPLDGGRAGEGDLLVSVAETLATRSRNPTIRAVRRQLRQSLRVGDPFAPSQHLKRRAETSLTWRIREILDPGSMSEPDRDLARYGAPEPLDIEWFGASPTDAEACIETMTRVEAYTVRDLLVALVNSGRCPPPEFSLLSMIPTDLAEIRINELGDPSAPLTSEILEDLRGRADEIWEEAATEDDPDQLTLFDIAPDM